jgi:ribosomal protein RSM22 (predicted rRNA methylase)
VADGRLPEALQAAIDAEIDGQPLGQAASLSAAYRARQSSQTAIADQSDVAAYLVSRLPATYAAIATVLEETGLRLPTFSPTSMLDAGAGPGTASWAAATAFPALAAITLVDHNRKLLDIGARLRRNAAEPLASAEAILGDFVSIPLTGRQFDLVVVSYALTELPEGQLLKAAATLWENCLGALVIVEPGRPRDYQRLIAVRAALIEAGGSIVAPCPHGLTCPLPDGDWCHFSVRLPRRRLHRQAKGATLGYEDEKFSYLIVARSGLERRPIDARVIKPPALNKFEIALPLCSKDGLEERRVGRREVEAFRAVRKLEWGDAIE